MYHGIWGIKGNNFFEYSNLSPVTRLNIGDEVMPLMFQNRHGGATVYLYKLFSYILPPALLHPTWVAVWNGINIALFSKLLKQFNFTAKAIIITLACLIVDPLVVHSYSFFISEQLTIAAILVCIILLKSKDENVKWAGLVAGLGLYIRVNFIWFLPILFPFYKKLLSKKFIFYFLVGIIPQIIFMNYSLVSSELMQARGESSLQGAFYWVLSALIFKQEYLGYFAFSDGEGFPILALILFCAISLIVFLDKNKRLSLYLLAYCALSAVIIDILVSNKNNYPLYFFFVPWCLWFLFGQSFHRIKAKLKNYLVVIVICLQFVYSSLVLTHYKQNGFSSRHNLKVYTKVAEFLKSENVKKLYLLNHTSRGIFEYLTQEEIIGISLDHLIKQYKLRNIGELLTYSEINSGVLLVVTDDYWSSWYQYFSNYSFKKQVEGFSKYQLKVKKTKEFKKAILVFFEKE